MNMKYRGILFDLDGTALDTLEDLRAAINHALRETGRRGSLTPAEAAACVGSGLKIACVRALCLEEGSPLSALEAMGTPGDPLTAAHEAEAERVLAVLKPWYAAHSEIATRPYPGIPELMAALRREGCKTAVVSNKPDGATGALCGRYFPGLLDLALGEREPEVRRKPAPDLALRAMAELGLAPGETVYIGDSEIDLQTAANAGLPCITVTWGFRSRDFLLARGAETLADSVEELAALLGISGGPAAERR